MHYCNILSMVRVVAFSGVWMTPYIPEDCLLVDEPTTREGDDYNENWCDHDLIVRLIALFS
jgi:hypothetical protein